jgi:hypothetical protein
MTTVEAAPREAVELRVASRPPRWPRATGPLPSAKVAAMLPEPVPTEEVRVCCPLGVVKVTVEEDLADQELTTHDPGSVTSTTGVVREEIDDDRKVRSLAVTAAADPSLTR